MSRWHSYDVASISFNRSIYSLCDSSRLHKIPGVGGRGGVSCKMQRNSTCLKDIESHCGQTNLYSMERVFRRNCFRSGSPTCANLRCLHIPLKRSTI